MGSALSERGIRVWIDESEIKVGDSLVDALSKGLESSDYLGIILSPDSVSSEWVKREINSALMDEIDKRKVRVLPILYKECEIPPLLRDKIYTDFRSCDEDKSKFEKQVSHFVRQLLSESQESMEFPEGSAPVKILSKEKKTIKVEIVITISGMRYEVEIPLDARVSVIKDYLIRELGISARFEDGTPVSCRLFSKTRNVALEDILTFRQNGVQEMETLVFIFMTEPLAG